MGKISPLQIIIIILIIVIIFGARKLPDLASSVGKSLKIFKKEISELREDDPPSTPGSQPGVAPNDTAPYQQQGTAGSAPPTPDDLGGAAPPPVPPRPVENRGPSAASPGGSDNRP